MTYRDEHDVNGYSRDVATLEIAMQTTRRESLRHTAWMAAGLTSLFSAARAWAHSPAPPSSSTETVRAQWRQYYTQKRPGGGYGRRYFPNVALQSHEGREVRFYDDLIQGKRVVINFMYVSCADVCIPVTANLVRVQQLLADRIGRDIFMYSFTLDPQNDTPDILRQYVRQFKIGPGWQFFTGQFEDMEQLRYALGFWDRDPALDNDRTQHSGMVLTGNEPRQWWSACPGQGKPEWIAKSILWLADA